MSFTDHLKAILLDLNAAWVLWLLIVLGLLSLAVMVERAIFFIGLRANVRALSEKLDSLLRTDVPGALAFLRASRSPAAAVAAEGLKHADLGPAAAEKAMIGAVALERARLERGLAFLGTLGNNAPFVGLLGTVLGIIKAFQVLGVDSGGAAEAVDVASKAVMVGVAEALIATAVGLIVAIPCVAANNYFQRRIHSMLTTTEALRNLVLAHLHGKHAPLLLESIKPEPMPAAFEQLAKEL